MAVNDARWRGADMVIWPAVLVAAGSLVWALPATVAFVPDAPAAFWATALAALLVDVPMFAGSSRDDTRWKFTFAQCFAIATLVLWGVGPALVVLALATTVTALGQRMAPGAGLFLGARLGCACVAAEAVAVIVGLRPFNTRGDGLQVREALDVGLVVSTWLMVSFGLLVIVRVVSAAHGLRAWAPQLRLMLFRTVASVLLVLPLLAVVDGWWPLVVALPVLAWSVLVRQNAQEQERLTRDSLTGLLNRRGLVAGVTALTARDLIGREPRPFALVLIQLDAVPTITNTLGRDMSEQAIRLAARRLVDAHGADRVGQLSAEAFVLLLPDVDQESAEEETAKAVDLLVHPVEVDDVPFLLDPIGGVAISPEHGRELGMLLMKAGLAVTLARRRGQRCALYVRRAAAITCRRIELLRELRLALQDPDRRSELAVVYQPQVDLVTGHTVGVEALLRWTHPRVGPVPTNEVIEAIESSQLMRLLTRHVVGTVAAQLRRWNDEGRHLRASVNVSVEDLHDLEFSAEVQAALVAHGISPRQFTIEITERVLITDLPRVVEAGHALRQLGVGLSLDDFGTGYASMQQLRQLPLSEVKIDRTYVSTMAENPADRAIVTSVHQLAVSLGLEVVAEGIEDEQTVRALGRLPGTIGQGYHFGRPMTAEAIGEWLRGRTPGMLTSS